MSEINLSMTEFVGELRRGLNRSDAEAAQFLEGLFTQKELEDFRLRIEVRDAIMERLLVMTSISFSSVAKECNCSEKLVGRVWRAIRDQYPAEPVSELSQFTLAIPKEDRAQLLVETILAESGFCLDTRSETIIDMKKGIAPIAFRVMRGREIPSYLKAGIVQAGFLGNDKLIEIAAEAKRENQAPLVLDIREKFRENAFRMCLAVPGQQTGNFVKSVKDLEGRKIATSYPNTLKQFLAARGVTARVEYLSGGVEESCRDLRFDAIMDIVETGSSLKKNNLVVLGEPLYEGNMSLISLPVARGEENEALLASFARRLKPSPVLAARFG